MAERLAFTITGKDEGSAAFRKFGSTVKKTYADVDKAGKNVAKTGDKAGATLGKSFLGGLAGVLTFQAVKGVFSSVVGGASDLNETMSATAQIFGTSAVAINKWGKDAARSLGLSQQAAQSNANSLGLLFTQVGFNSDAAAEMSKKWVQLAVDLGSFANADPTEILRALQSATRGEFDELQRFVPMISAATVEQEALRITGKKTTDQLSAQDKVLAVQELAFAQTGKAQGDFARTQDGVANSTKQARAEFDNLAASIGKSLQPAAAGALHFLNDQLLPTLGELDDQFRALPKGVQIASVAVAGLAGTSGAGIASARKLSGEVKKISEAFQGLSRLGKITALSFGAVGVALTAGALVLAHFANQSAQAKQKVSDFKDTLDETTGAITAETRVLELNNLRSQGFTKIARDLGLSLNDVVSAALGQQDAIDRVNGVLDTYTTTATGAYDATGKVTYGVNQNSAAAQKLSTEINGNREALTKAQKEKREDIAVSKGGAEANAKLGESHKTAAQAAKEQEDALKALIDKLTKFSGQALAATDAEIGYQQAIDDAVTALKDNGRTLDLNTQKGRDNQRALDDIVSATNNLIEVKAKDGAKEPELIRLRDRGTTAFYKQARQMGLNAEEADKLTKKYFGIPGSVLTKLQADKRDAESKIKSVKKQLADKNLTKTRRAKLEAEIKQLQRAVQKAKDALASVHSKRVTVNVGLKIGYTSTQTSQLRRLGFFQNNAAGTSSARPGLSLVGEEGPELIRLHGGERIYTAAQTRAMASAAGGDWSGSAPVIQVHNHGVIGSQQQLKNWLSGAIDDLRREGRLRFATR